VLPALAFLLCAIALSSAPAYVHGPDSFSSATTITPGAYTSAQPAYGSSFYKIDVTRGTTLVALLQFDRGADYDLYVYDMYQQEVAHSANRALGVAELTQYLAVTTGYHLLEVRFISGSQLNYTLTVDLSRFTVLSTNWGSPGSPEEAGPGETGAPFSVTVRNENDYAVAGLTGALNLPTFFTNVMGGLTATASYSGTVAPGQTFTLAFPLDISAGATVGVYACNLTLGSYQVSGSRLLAKLPVNLTVDIWLTGKSLLQAALSPRLLTPGTANMLTLNVSNTGTAPADAVQLVVRPPAPLVTTGGDTWMLGSLSPGETASATFTLYVPATSQLATYQLGVTLSYTNVLGLQTTETLSLAFLVPQLVETRLAATAEPQEAPTGVLRRLHGKLTRADTGAGVPGATIYLDSVDPRLTSRTTSVATDSFGYWEAHVTPEIDGTYVYTARFDGGPTPQNPATVYGSSRSETSLAATAAIEMLCPNPWQVASPAERLSFTLQITNRGPRTETYYLDATGLPQGASTSFSSNGVSVKEVQVAPGQTAALTLSVLLPEGLAGGVYRFQFTAKGEFAERSLALTVTVQQPQRQVELSSPFLSLTAATGQSLSYPVRVSNLGVEPEQVFVSMNLTGDVLDWTPSFAADGKTIDHVTLGPGESQWIVFTASPPYLVKVDEYHLLLFAATQDGKYTSTLSLTARILGSYKVEIDFQPVNPTVAVGERTEVTVVASNTGESPVSSLRLNVNVTGPSLNLPVTVVPVDVLSVAPRERATFVLRIAPASTAATGDYRLRVEAVSAEGSFGVRELVVSVQTAIPWLYIQVGIAAIAAGIIVLAVERLLSRLKVKVRKD